jgi:WXG100 family type VII secretion target
MANLKLGCPLRFYSNFFAGEVSIEVAPDKLYNTADEILKEINTVHSEFENISNRIEHTSSYWEGEVSDERREHYKSMYKNVGDMISNLNNYVQELRIMASNYIETETKATEEANSLPTNILS